MKGIIVDIKGKYAVAMTSDGSFVKIKNRRDLVVGCEADFTAAPQLHTGLVARVSSIAAVFLLVFGIGWGVYAMPSSYVNVDINPSIQLTANLFDRIIRVEALNEDGRTLVASRKFNNLTLEDGIVGVIEEAAKAGYLQNGAENAIILSISSNNQGKAFGMQEKLKSAAETEFNRIGLSSEVIVEKGTVKKLESARALGISPGKLTLIEKLLEQDPSLTIEELKDDSVRDIMKTLKKGKVENKSENNGSQKENGKSGNGDKGVSGGSTDETSAIITDPSAEDGSLSEETQGKKDNHGQDKKESETAQDNSNQDKNDDRNNGKSTEKNNGSKGKSVEKGHNGKGGKANDASGDDPGPTTGTSGEKSSDNNKNKDAVKSGNNSDEDEPGDTETGAVETTKPDTGNNGNGKTDTDSSKPANGGGNPDSGGGGKPDSGGGNSNSAVNNGNGNNGNSNNGNGNNGNGNNGNGSNGNGNNGNGNNGNSNNGNSSNGNGNNGNGNNGKK